MSQSLDSTCATAAKKEAESSTLPAIARAAHSADKHDAGHDRPGARLSCFAEPLQDTDFGIASNMVEEVRVQGTVVAPEVLHMLQGSAAFLVRPAQLLVYVLALGGVVFTLVAAATELGVGDGGSQGSAPARRLGGGVSETVRSIAFALVGAGLFAFLANLLKQPLILGYLLGGVLVGPNVCAFIRTEEQMAAFQDLSSLGLIFLLFMIGLELNLKELLKMGKVVLVTGLLQFPICAGVMFGIFTALQALGLSFGSGDYVALYMALTCSISSTMIVVKLLAEQMQSSLPHGRLTVGILIFQDIWAIIVLAIQPKLANPDVLGLLRIAGMTALLIVLAVFYAKLVMPVVLLSASRAVELMLVIALAWCFFVGCFATLPFIGLSMELAALIAGVVLAAFPYSAEFLGKIKHIRDFFIVLFFVGIGMQIPAPTLDALTKGLLVAAIVAVVRWLGIFLVVWCLGGGGYLATMATVNLSQVSEFALVICTLGMGYGHVEESTRTILIWAFAIMALASSFAIERNQRVYNCLADLYLRCRGVTAKGREQAYRQSVECQGHVCRDIVFLGFYKVASALIQQIESKQPQLLQRIHVIDFNMDIVPKLEQKGLKCSYGDITSPEVLEHLHHGSPSLVILSIPDSLLQSTSNAELLRTAQGVWPRALHIATADTPMQASELHAAGAHYVLRSSQLCADRLQRLLTDFVSESSGGELPSLLYRSSQGFSADEAFGSQGLSSLMKRASIVNCELYK